jgi:hypothetical protein
MRWWLEGPFFCALVRGAVGAGLMLTCVWHCVVLELWRLVVHTPVPSVPEW